MYRNCVRSFVCMCTSELVSKSATSFTKSISTSTQSLENIGYSTENSSAQQRRSTNASMFPSRTVSKDAFLYAFMNKGTAYSMEERRALGLTGLLPPVVHSLEEQVEHSFHILQTKTRAIDKYEWLMRLHATNITLFYALALKHVFDVMPLIYTPTVGEACLNFSLVSPEPRGLYISLNDADNIQRVLSNWPAPKTKVIVVTDGERILGLGDLGTYGMGIPIGKLALYTALAGVRPEWCLPITLDLGTNTKRLWTDPMYTGIKKPRIVGDEFNHFMEKFMTAVVERFGNDVLIQFEDFGNHNAFYLLEKYRNQYLCFNDDIQGTAAVTLAGILSALRITKVPLSKNVFLSLGAGEASLGIGKLIVAALKQMGVSEADAISKIYMIDSKGLIVRNREGDQALSSEKAVFIKDLQPQKDLEQIVNTVKPTVLIGAASLPGSFTEQVLSRMATLNSRPVVFALSNPTTRCECTAEVAYRATKGRVVFATGSPFGPVTLGDKVYHTGQCNNAYIFPAMGLACIAGKIKTVPDELFLVAAQALADLATEKDLDSGQVFPQWKDIRNVSSTIVEAILKEAYKRNLCRRLPQPEKLSDLIKPMIYVPKYSSSA